MISKSTLNKKYYLSYWVNILQEVRAPLVPQQVIEKKRKNEANEGKKKKEKKKSKKRKTVQAAPTIASKEAAILESTVNLKWKKAIHHILRRGDMEAQQFKTELTSRLTANFKEQIENFVAAHFEDSMFFSIVDGNATLKKAEETADAEPIQE